MGHDCECIVICCKICCNATGEGCKWCCEEYEKSK